MDSPSKRTVFVLALSLFGAFFTYHKWNLHKVVEKDTRSYYSYLPAVFIYGDISMNYTRQGDPYWSDKQAGRPVKLPSGRKGRIQKYTMGLAILYSPFFALGHASSKLVGAPADGYSMPYMFWLQFSGLFYFVLGLVFLRKLLLRHFNEVVSSWTLFSVAMGTNLLYYGLNEALMPHVFMFALITCFLWTTVKFLEYPALKTGLLIGMLGGLIVLSRPNHILIWLIPLLYRVGSFEQMKQRLRFFLKQWKYPLLWLVLSLLIASPQMLYWHYLTGEWIHYSYAGESFFLTEPRFYRNWFSFRKGWLLWTPAMSFALWGIFLLRRRATEWKLAVPAFFIPAAWLVASWWCWWWGDAFGNRPMIDLYGLLALPFACSISSLLEKPKLMKWLGMGFLYFLIALNIFQSLHKHVIHYDSMTMRAYFAVFGRMKHPENWEDYLDHPDHEAARQRSD